MGPMSVLKRATCLRRSPHDQSAPAGWLLSARRLGTAISAAVLLAWLGAAPEATARTLPVVVDASDGADRAWWAEREAIAPGPFDAALWRNVRDDAAWIAPDRSVPSTPVSRVFARADISDANARALAGLYGATHALVGRVEVASASPVEWLRLPRVALRARLRVVDVATGAVVTEVELRRTGFSADGVAAAAAALGRGASTLAVRAAATRVAPSVADGAHQVVVACHDGAAPYVAFKAALREASGGVIDVSEAWATEGRVGLAVALDEDVRFDDLVSSLLRMPAQRFDGFRAVSVQREDNYVLVVLGASDAVADGGAGL